MKTKNGILVKENLDKIQMIVLLIISTKTKP